MECFGSLRWAFSTMAFSVVAIYAMPDGYEVWGFVLTVVFGLSRLEAK